MEGILREASGDGSRRGILTAEESLHFAFCGVEEEQYDLNRRAASRAERLADAIGWARSHPEIYALAGDDDPVRTAERCAVLEASARLNLSEATVRSLAATADAARLSLPLLWSRAREGFAAMTQVDAAVALLCRFAAHADALPEFDRLLAEVSLHASPAAFRAKATRLVRRLAPLPEAELHAEAFTRRRVVVQAVEDGMSWVSAYVATVDAVAIQRSLTSTAKHFSKVQRDGRTRDQLRADLFRDRLTGRGTPGAVKTKVFVTVPLDKLAPAERASVRRTTPRAGGVDLNTEPLLDTGGPIDDATAIRLLLEAGTFTRVITDPVTGVVLDMDRRSRKVTRQQREWLSLRHAHCTRDGCRRPAAEADIDHWIPYAAHGPTDEANLHPLCDPDHALRDTTRLRFRRRPDDSVELRFPTGHTTRRLLDSLPPPGGTPPF
ncbi:HNH endonuclease signature motif containing protein [Microbacterium sp. BK668]|uniref:HNH endonuclease signature motif containing protein n=1 Tax=Microbacterium sp. BK668 TaxID=2512118 RepID=UPI00105D09F4|nr:HNH endonuclease signature motif containing protein [Microbacterium sp. BK668]TDN91679.1 5-methylcytosine-specific restriction endonuclease McrA [Microbacterium sp. BK668]